MEIIADNACHAFLSVTKELLVQDRIDCLHITFPTSKRGNDDDRLASIFDRAFVDKAKKKGGTEMVWREWLINSGFPERIYKEHGCNLVATIEDPRIWEQNFQSAKSNHNFFGRMCRPLPQHNGKSFMHYLLERWRNPPQRSQPNFYFDVESPEWIWHELIKNPRQIKTGRSGATCATNMYFRWNPGKNSCTIGWIIKHCYFSHLYQDIYSPQLIINAILEELGIDVMAQVSTFCISISMDRKAEARHILDDFYGVEAL